MHVLICFGESKTECVPVLDRTTTYKYEKSHVPVERALEQKNGSTKLQCTKSYKDGSTLPQRRAKLRTVYIYNGPHQFVFKHELIYYLTSLILPVSQ